MKTVLTVKDTTGNKIFANVTFLNGAATIELPYIEAVNKDNPEFAQNGIVKYTVPQHRYHKAKLGLTRYLESLFLKELSSNANIYPSDGGKSNKSGSGKKPKPRANKKASGKNSDPVCDRGRGKEQPKGYRGRVKDSDLAKGSDQENVGDSEVGNETIQES